MHNHPGAERRRTTRKEVFLSIKLIAEDVIISIGQLLNINCFGVKLEIMFTSNEEKSHVEKILELHDITLEIGEEGSILYMKVPVDVKWSTYNYDESDNTFTAGMDLKLDEQSQEEWKKFYNRL